MAQDFLLKEVRRLVKVEMDRSEVWKKLDILLGDNIKEAVLDSEIQVKKQELVAIKQDIATATEQWEAERKKREADTKAEIVRGDNALVKTQREYETRLNGLKVEAERKEAEYKNVIRGQEQRVSQAQRKADEGVQEIVGNAESRKLELKKEVVHLTELRDSMKEEIRAMQSRFGVRV